MNVKNEFNKMGREIHDERSNFELACDTLFRGFVPTREKRCLRKFKDVEELMSLEDARKLDEFAGILKKGVILLDFDNKDQGECFGRILKDSKLEYFRMETTRGIHFYFLQQDDDLSATVGANLACGLECDIKCGNRNGYAILKYAGEEREVSRVSRKMNYLPNWARPVKNYGNLTFFGMKDGDGRNQTLFRYVVDLVNNGYREQDVKFIINIINNYVFAQPLVDDEIKTILRKDAFPQDGRKAKNGTKEKSFNDEDGEKEKFDIVKIGTEIIEKLHICVINGTICGYNGKIYTSDRSEINRFIYHNWNGINVNKCRELWAFMESECSVMKDLGTEDARYIAFVNGVYDIVDCKLYDFEPKFHITNIIPHKYNEDAKCELVDRTLDKLSCNDESIRSVMEECIGYCFYRANELSKSFLFIGDKSNGKSTFLGMIKHLLGLHNISALDLSQMDGRFSVASMVGKLANLGDDISDEFCKGDTVAVFKKIVSGNMVQAEFKNQTPFVFIPTVKLLFSSNELPRMRGSEEAIARRMVIVPFNATFSKEDADYDPYIVYKLQSEDAMEYLIQIALDGLYRVLDTKGFTDCSKVDKMLAEFNAQNDPMLEWLEDTDCKGRCIDDCYMSYRVYCEQGGYNPIARGKFTRRVCSKQNLQNVVKRVNGNLKRCFF